MQVILSFINILLIGFGVYVLKKRFFSKKSVGKPSAVTYKEEKVVIDDRTIDKGDFFEIIEPVFQKVDIYGSYDVYKK